VYRCVDEMTIGGADILCMDGIRSFEKTMSISTLGSGSKSGYVKVESRSATHSLCVLTHPGTDLNCGAYAHTGADTNRSIALDHQQLLRRYETYSYRPYY